MHAVILCAGFGSRYGGDTPKAFQILSGRQRVIDHVVSTVWVPGITGIHVVHNDRVVKTASGGEVRWARAFKEWKSAFRWEAGPGERPDPPYIKLFSDESTEDPRGAVGSLAALFRRARWEVSGSPALVVCGDDIFTDLQLDKLVDNGTTSALTYRHQEDVGPEVLKQEPSRILLGHGEGSGTIMSRVPWDGEESPYLFCGAFYIAARDIQFVVDYADILEASGDVADGIHDLFDAMCEDRRWPRCIQGQGIFATVNDMRGLAHAQAELKRFTRGGVATA